MKKVACLALVFLMLSMAACSADGEGSGLVVPGISGSGTQETPAAKTEVTVEQAVILDQDGVKIQVKQLTKGLLGPELKVLIENTTDKDLTIQCRDSSVNGYMVETMFSVDVAAGKKANDEITFMTSDMELCGIETIADIELSFVAFGSDDWKDYLESDLVQIKTSVAETYSQSYDHTGTQVYEGKDVKVIVKGLDESDDIFGPSVVVYIQNTGSKAVLVQTNNISVNGFMVNPFFSQEVLPGKHAVAEITFMTSELEENDITQIENVELSFCISDAKTYKTIVNTDVVELSFK